MTWTPDLRELAKTLWADGCSATQIAHRLGGGLTRCAVLGVIHRAGLHRSAPSTCKSSLNLRNNAASIRRLGKARSAKSVPLAIGGNGQVFEKPEGQASAYVSPAEAWAPLPGGTGRPWSTRGHGECAFPIAGDGPEIQSCCAPIKAGSAYCAEHHAMMYQPPKKGVPRNGSELARSLRRFI